MIEKTTIEKQIIKSVCRIHGEYSPKIAKVKMLGRIFEITSGCPHCAEIEKKREIKRREEEYIHYLMCCGITKRFANADFDNYRVYTKQQKDVLDACREYAKRCDEVAKTGENLLLIGAPGTGKNHLATAILKEFLKKKKIARLIKVYKYLRHIKETYSKKGETESDIMRKALDLDLLILDEWGFKANGEGEMSETDKSLIFEIVDDRYEAKKPTIIISNLKLSDLKSYIGSDRIIDRLCQNHKQLIFNWESYRKNGGSYEK